jgi:uncharacterized membrane protein YfcA
MDRLTEERTTEKRVRKMTTSANRSFSPGKLAWVGISSITVVGLIHLIEAPEELEETTYLGPLFLANFGGAITAAIGIYRNYRWGWSLGALVAGGAFVGYVLSRTIGLPGMPVEEWLEPLGVLSLLVEALFVRLCLAYLRPPYEGGKNSSS